MVDYADYDAWAAEASDDDGPLVTVAGRKWRLPARHEVSAKAVADFQRLRARVARDLKQAADDDPVPDSLAEGLESLTPASLLRLLIGEQVDEMLAAGASQKVIERLAGDFAAYAEQGTGPLAHSRQTETDPEMETDVGEEGSPSATSHSGGPSSKQTSSESTDSS